MFGGMYMEMELNRLPIGSTATVSRMETPPELSARLHSFGLTAGTPVQCCYRSPGGKVTALGFSGTVVAVRTRELRNITVCL